MSNPTIPTDVRLEGQRCTLRTPLPADDAEIARIYSDPQTMQHLISMAKLDTGGWTVEDTKARREGRAVAQAEGHCLNLVIVVHDHGKEVVAGNTGFRSVDLTNRNAECGIILDVNYWRHGVGSEALTMVLTYGFDTLGLHRIEFKTLDANVGMRKWCEDACGVPLEAVHKEYIRIKDDIYADLVAYAIFESDWRMRVTKRLQERLDRKNNAMIEGVFHRMAHNW